MDFVTFLNIMRLSINQFAALAILKTIYTFDYQSIEIHSALVCTILSNSLPEKIEEHLCFSAEITSETIHFSAAGPKI